MKAIGILGGTFDPIHLGHLHVALSTYYGLHLQEVRLIPSASPLLRQPPQASAEQRLRMVKLAVEGHVELVVDDREIRRGGDSYMVETLASLRAEMTATPLCCILSTDQFIQFDQWKNWRHILDLAHLIVTTRPGYVLRLNAELKQVLQEKQTRDFHLLHQAISGLILLQDIIPLPISSTQIRDEMAVGKNPARFLPPLVWEFMGEEGLYC